MNVKRISAMLTAFVMTAGALAFYPSNTLQKAEASSVFVENDFDITYEGWINSSENVVLTADETLAHNGSRSMHVENRVIASDGVSSAKGFYLDGGNDYDYSIYVYHSSGKDENFNLSLTYLCADGETFETVELASEDVASDEWTEITATYKAPAGATEFIVKLDTDSTTDFNFDDFLVTGDASLKQNTVSAADGGLKDEFANYFRVGNILNGGTVQNSTILATILKNYNSIECENETKPDATIVQSQCSGTNIAVSLNSAAAIFDFCIKNNIGVRGHTLVWHSQTPVWFFKENFNKDANWVSPSVMDQRMESYIKNMFNAIKTQYPTLNLYAYDVANECISDDSNRTANNGGTRVPGENKNGESPWVQVYGSNIFVEKAFTYARQYAPEGCALYYNDYNEYWDHKRDAIYSMCKSLYEKGLLDGVGMQSHINADSSGFSGTENYIYAMKKYLSIGCDVQITELDISTEGGKFSAQQQAEKYKAIFQAAVDWNKNPQSTGRVTAVCIWGPNDANTWIKTENAPLLHDTNNNPKAAYTALMSLLPSSEWGDGSNPVGPGVEIKPAEPDSNGYYYHDTFEGSLGDWSARGGCELLTSGRIPYKGTEALLIMDRTDAWNGAQMALSTRTFEPGKEYAFSVCFASADGPSEIEYKLTLQYDLDGKTNYEGIAQASTANGEYVQLYNPKYKIPEGATNLYLVAETTEETCNFYIDEAIIAVAGTSIEGPSAKKLMAGDIDSDGRISVADLVLMKNGLLKGFADSTAQSNADVDKSRKVDSADALYLTEYLLGKISEFPKAQVAVDTAKMDSVFSSLKLSESLKEDGENNPLYTQRFGADPGFMVYKDRLYVYTTNDAFEYDSNGNLKENSYDVGTINCCSSSDLVNWTDHGAIPVAGRNGRTQNGAASWASCSWAPDACWKTINGKDKFFLYFANSGGGIGVLTADSPTGPWTDPLGHALVTGASPNCSDVVWMFDPGVMVDDDGTGYLFFGGGVDNKDKSNPKTGRCVKLGDDMISLAGTPVTMETPYLFEDSSIIKLGDTYYYSYCSNWNVPAGTSINGQSFGSGDICYMTSKNPLGPYTFAGRVFANTGGQGLDKGGNNHHSIVSFKDKLYVLYHTRVVENRMGITQNYRSPSISEATLSNGKLSCSGSHKGVAQLETLNPYVKTQAETMSNQAGTNVRGVGDTVVTDINAGDWIKVAGVNFSKGASTLKVKASSKSGGAIKVCAGGPSGKAVAYVEIPSGGKLDEIEVPVFGELNGTTDISFVFTDDVEFDYWQFS